MRLSSLNAPILADLGQYMPGSANDKPRPVSGEYKMFETVILELETTVR